VVMRTCLRDRSCICNTPTGPLRFQAGCRRRLNLALVFDVDCDVVHLFVLIGECVLLLLSFFVLFHTKPRDWLGNVAEICYFVMDVKP